MPVKMKSGKSYLTVIERMNLLLEEKGKEDYSLETSVQYDSGIVIVKATLTLFYCYPKDETNTVQVVSRKYCGHALGELGKAKTLEATETHAIGRALATAGWFGDEFASANEMESWESGNKKLKKEAKMLHKKPEKVDLPEMFDGDGPHDFGGELDSNENQDTVEVSKTVKGKLVYEDMKVFFGKNKGKMISECEEGYLKWLSGSAGKENLEGWLKDKEGFPENERINLLQKTAGYFAWKIKEEEAIPF